MDWVWAAVSIVGGFGAAAVVSRLVRANLERRRGTIAAFAPAAASLVFSLLMVAGLLVALGFVQPESLYKLRDDTIVYLPRALSALIVVILGGVVGTLVSTATRESFGRSMGRMGEKLPTAVKGAITAFAAILAASQLGIDTTVINIVVAGVIFGFALAFALVVGFGSRPVATELACGRAMRRTLRPGDSITTPTVSGLVRALHPTAAEFEVDGSQLLVPYSQLASSQITVTRAPSTD